MYLILTCLYYLAHFLLSRFQMATKNLFHAVPGFRLFITRENVMTQDKKQGAGCGDSGLEGGGGGGGGDSALTLNRHLLMLSMVIILPRPDHNLMVINSRKLVRVKISALVTYFDHLELGIMKFSP